MKGSALSVGLVKVKQTDFRLAQLVPRANYFKGVNNSKGKGTL